MTDKAQRIMNDTSDVSGWVKFGYFEEIKVNYEEGIDKRACGLNLRKCQTISFTRNVIDLTKNSPTVISVDPSSYSVNNYEIESARIEFNNAGNGKVTVVSSISSGALFAVSTGSLKISSFDIVHDTEKSSKTISLFLLSSTGTMTLQNCNISVDSGNTESNPLKESLFVLRGGSANIEGTTINPIVFASKAAITFSEGCDLVIDNSTFLNVLRQSGSGGGIEGVVGTGKSLQIKGGSMNGCVTGSGNGGGMALRTKADSSIKIIQTENGGVGTSLISCTSQTGGGSGGLGGGIYLYVEDINGADLGLKGTTFSECSASKGNNIFVDGYNLSQIVTKENFEIDFNESDFRAMEGFERSTTAESFSIPLVTYLRAFNGTVYVAGSDGHDYSGCGFSDSACASMEYAIPLRFGNRERQFYLLPPFAFERALVIDEQPTTFMVEQIGTQVKICEDISSTGESIIRTSKDCSFSGMCFLLPSSSAVDCKSVFHCCEKNLTLTDCSFASESNLIGISICIVSKGCMSFRQFALNGLTFSTRSLLVIEGSEASCICENLDWMNISTQSVNAAIKACEGALLEIRNSQVNGMTQEESSFIEVIGSAIINVNSSTFKSVQRNHGNGGSFEGVIKGGKTMNVWNCTLEQCVCKETENAFGGGLNMDVETGGTLIMSNNTVKGCCVNENVGVGGGIYLKLGESGVKYAMKQILFEGNKAWWGKDVFLVCPSPRDAITNQQWEGSAFEDEEEANKWVVDSETNAVINRSVLYYLFPPILNTVYISSGGSSDGRCGDDQEPCMDLMFGFNKMRTDQTTIRVVDSCCLREILDRNGFSLTIRGQSFTSKSLFLVEADGGLVLKMETSSVSLMLSCLKFGLPLTSSVEELISVDGGKLYIDNCQLGGTSAEEEQTNMWIIRGKEGYIQVTKVLLSNVAFSGGSGIISLSGGSVQIESSELTFVKADSSLVNVTNCEKVEVADGCIFDNCKSGASEGGAVRCSLTVTGRFSVTNASITNSGMNENTGKGGGVYLLLPEGTSSDCLFGDITFISNSAELGKDMFLVCDNLNVTVTTTTFQMKLINETGERVAEMMGYDRNYFCESVHDLYLFLVQYHSPTVQVSPSGYDMTGCGNEHYPCSSFWRGFRNIQVDAFQKRICISEGARVDHLYDLSSFSITSPDISKKSTLSISSSISENFSEAVFVSCDNLDFERIVFSLPSFFSSGQAGLLLSTPSSEKGLSINNCSFAFDSSSAAVAHPSSSNVECQYYLIHSVGGFVHLSLCIVDAKSFAAVPFLIKSSFSATECTFSGIETPNNLEGGAVACYLSSTQTLSLQKCEMTICACSESSGFGGFMFIDSLSASSIQPFTLKDATFFDNRAFAGSNLFIRAEEFNESVTNTTFCFNYLPFADDGNAFVGTDSRFENTDLLRFLIKYSSNMIYVSSRGSDVKRCGKENDPCETFWKGMKQIDTNAETKELFIEHSSILENAFELSNFSIAAVQTDLEELEKAKLILKKPYIEEITEGYFSTSWSLSFTSIDIFLDSTLADTVCTVMCSKSGALSISDCSLSSSNSAHFSDMIFATIKSGSLEICGFDMCSSVFEAVLFEIWSGCCCVLKDISMENVTANGGIIQYVDGSTSERNEQPTIEMNGSVFKRVTASFNGASVFGSCFMSSWVLAINGSEFDMCRSEMSEKGGVVLMMLGSSGRFEMNNSKITNCGCSPTIGRGGGVYVKAEGQASLNFIFKGCEFRGNGAWKGRDVFVECWKIAEQINETQFLLDLRPEVYNRFDAIYGIDEKNYVPVDLIEFVTIYQQSTIIVSSLAEKNGTNGRQCGKVDHPCVTVGQGLEHMIIDYAARLLIDGCSEIERECDFAKMEVKSLGREKVNVTFGQSLSKTREYVIFIVDNVLIESVSFKLAADSTLLHSSLFFITSGQVSLVSCEFCGEADRAPVVPKLISATHGVLILEEIKMKNLNCTRTVECEGGRIQLQQLWMEKIHTAISSIYLKKMNGSIEKVEASDCVVQSGSFIEMEHDYLLDPTIDECSIKLSLVNLTKITSSDLTSCLNCRLPNYQLSLSNCTFSDCLSSEMKLGEMVVLSNCSKVNIKSCQFEGKASNNSSHNLFKFNSRDEICKWNGSLIDSENSSISIDESFISKSPNGGLSIFGGNASVEKGEFYNNNPSINKYPSSRRNIICANSGLLDVVSLKGGDGLKDNTSLWILSDGCTLSGLAAERPSPFFMPTLQAIDTNIEGNEAVLTFTGTLLLPCNLSFRIITAIGDVELIDRHYFHEDGFVSENSTIAKIPAAVISDAPDTADVYGCILFGDAINPSSTELVILKNKTESKTGNDNLAEGGKEVKSSWALIIAVIFVVLFLIVLVVAVAFIVRWRKQKRRTKELEIIVEDTVKKDPKAFEMVTMEMSPEAQWRRGEREAEKKNEERIKKRVYENSLGHSESSEHLLSESGSTEYILGRDSDKIPQWMLEKADEKEEEEETRKRSPSPSISSTSTISTTDSDSTFVRGEDLCPTTSSMSNLVDAMACSSPHEKLIVDLRDSLFMLLHGRNKTKEMAIGSFQQREQTAAQILFWVANLALHSFEEMENGLSSLANLSPHIVLFSEHMVICIALHSDCSSDDSDTSSISSSTVVTSANDDDDDDDSLPSSAFEDEDDFKKECLRWKAPELLINKKMMATKESVAFSIGMMLWECLTLQIPFGEYEAEVAGQKIVNGERPSIHATKESSMVGILKGCLSAEGNVRPTLLCLKREFIQRFPAGAAMITISDAIDYEMVESSSQSEKEKKTNEKENNK
ncbi:uncharacterized protein MONOS_10539 [Monocercomonoides exilis]|uniref:uncharacterized protein n=1 Tax=Monocercomonoides exilis TaxID=2049356 RepID=UPI00355A5F80|nr:hypothetical protein MONOS_10539 [Monocercomonoides exilis]|eukprot:MONOS_10539.1-p1 / transcript=MONOS_10539.1 / gene=MONOS_10539 / organism=Monocercomonoides_exilis_PA203 / gene_product=unspecified product / transcript_product=unspecified product / location=Mono_scaffold00483:12838-21195(+) / protein_length=2785 / sequence_SO=supercontig / SO=protein_coding / is_pseudo=false